PFISKREADPTRTLSVFSTIERKDVGITLKITPQITEGDYVKLDIYQEISSVIAEPESVVISVGPSTTKRATRTSVVAKNAKTIVISGLMQEKQDEQTRSIPVLSDIPLLGWLFKNKTVNTEKTNLLVFITPHIVKDLLAGRVSSEVMCIVYTPRNGFGKYIKVPERCIWTVKSEKPRYVVVGNRPVVYYDKRTVYVPLPTGGEYRDFTYGYAYSVDPREDAELIRVGLAYLVIVLRRYFGIPLGTVLYDVTKIGEYKYFSLYEPEAAGLVETIDWPSVRKLVESHKPDDLDRIMMSEIDDMAYSTLITMEFNWDLVKEHAVKVVDYVLARDRVKAMFRGKEMYIPRPSPALKLLSYSIISEVLDGEAIAPSLLTGHGVYNGETFLGDVDVYPSLPLIKPPQPLLRVEEAILDKVFYEDYKLIVEDRRTTLVQLRQANLKRLVSLVENDKGQVIDLSMLAGKCGMEFVSVEELSEAFGSLPSINYASIRDTLRKVREYRKMLQREREEVLKYLEERSKSLYIAYLVLNELLKDSK
ncbi:MAG: hypothetical protein QXQ73_04215, partial [Desulfurococcaceae archaeon]